MKPRRTPSSNVVYRLPGGTEDNDLWAERTIAEGMEPGDPAEGRMMIRSVWELDAKERAAVAAGANVELSVYMGDAQPPVGLRLTHQKLGRGDGDAGG